MIALAALLSRKSVPWIFGGIVAVTLFGLGVRLGLNIRAGQTQAARQELTDWKHAEQVRLAEESARQLVIRDEVRKSYDETQDKINALAGDVRRLSRGVQVCASVSTLPASATGTDAEAASGEPRPAVEVLAELSARFAEAADRNATQLNSLIDWIERTRLE